MESVNSQAVNYYNSNSDNDSNNNNNNLNKCVNNLTKLKYQTKDRGTGETCGLLFQQINEIDPSRKSP